MKNGAAMTIEGEAVLLPDSFDYMLFGYTIPEDTRLVVGIYDIGFMDDDDEDKLLDAMREIKTEIKPVLMRV